MKKIDFRETLPLSLADQAAAKVNVEPENLATGWVVIEVHLSKPIKGKIYFNQNDHSLLVALHKHSEDKYSLIFHRDIKLKAFNLSWNKSEKISIKHIYLYRISSFFAYFMMMRQVSLVATKSERYQVYLKSWARFRKKGTHQFKRKLIESYEPLLLFQLVSSEPYRYWQLKLEDQTNKKQLSYNCNYSQIFFYVYFMDTPSNDDKQAIMDQSYANYAFLEKSESLTANQYTYLLQLKSGDRLATNAFKDLAYWLKSKSYPLIMSFDHDYLDEQGYRSCPRFKPKWNLDYFSCYDYIGSSFVLSCELLPKIDLAWSSYRQLLSLLASKKIEDIEHFPRILKHCASSDVLPSEIPVIKELIVEWMQERQEPIDDIIWNKALGVFKLSYPVLDNPLVSIIIPTRDQLHLTRNCVQSILELTEYRNFEILIIDNQSSQADTLEWFESVSKLAQVRVLRYNHDFNYSAINNFAVSKSRGDYLCLLNNDTEVISADWLRELVSHAQRPKVACVGAKLYFEDDSIQHAGVILGLWGLAGHSHKCYPRDSAGYMQRLWSVQSYSAVTAACLVVKKELFEQVGGFNEKHLQVAFNDVDLCLKFLKDGYRNIWTPWAELYHYESKSRGKDDSPEKKARQSREIRYMQETWLDEIRDDKAYSPHLSRVREDFSIRLEADPKLLSDTL